MSGPPLSPPRSPMAGVRTLKDRFEALSVSSTMPPPQPTASSSKSSSAPTPAAPAAPSAGPPFVLATPPKATMAVDLAALKSRVEDVAYSRHAPPPPPRPTSSPVSRGRSYSSPPISPTAQAGLEPASTTSRPVNGGRSKSAFLTPQPDLGRFEDPCRTSRSADTSPRGSPTPSRSRLPTTSARPPPSPTLASNAPPVVARRKPPPPPQSPNLPTSLQSGTAAGMRRSSSGGLLISPDPNKVTMPKTWTRPPSRNESEARPLVPPAIPMPLAPDSLREGYFVTSPEADPEPASQGHAASSPLGGPPPIPARPKPPQSKVYDPFHPPPPPPPPQLHVQTAFDHPPVRPGLPPPPPPPPRPSSASLLSADQRAQSSSAAPRPAPPPPPPPPPIITRQNHSNSLPPPAPPLPERSRPHPPAGPRDWASEGPPDPSRSLPPPMTKGDGPGTSPANLHPPPPSRSVPVGAPIQPRKPSGPSAQSSPWSTPSGSGAQTPVRFGDDSDEEDDEGATPNGFLQRPDDMPDSTFANRRPPSLDPPLSLNVGTQYTAFAVRGRHLCTGHHHLRLWDTLTGEHLSTAAPMQEVKITAMEFKGSFSGYESGRPRFVWCGTKDGPVFEYDCEDRRINDWRTNLHGHPITGVFRLKDGGMCTLDESGKVQVWSGEERGAVRVSAMPRTQRIHEKTTWSAVISQQLWTSSGPASSKTAGSLATRSPSIRVYDPNPSKAWTVTPRPLAVLDTAGSVGAVTAGAYIPAHPKQVFLAHDTGHVSVWSTGTDEQPQVISCLKVLKISSFQMTALEGVTKYLWAGFRSGFVYVYDVSTTPWQVLKVWRAHKDPVTRIVLDPSMLWAEEGGSLHVATTSSDGTVHLWDGLIGVDWRATEMKKREAEFCSYRRLRVLICSWNVDANRPSDLSGTPDNLSFLENVLTSVDSPDIIVFGFQETIDLENKKLTAKSMLLGGRKKGAEKLSDHVSQAYRQWHDRLVRAVNSVMPADDPYIVIHTDNLVGLFSCVFVKTSEREKMREVAITTVKTGMKGRYGNKGAIVGRVVVDDSSVCFINCHLAAGQKHVRQRNADLISILEEKSAFPEPTTGTNQPTSSAFAYRGGGNGSSVLDHEVCFFHGDLNYRIDMNREDVIRSVASGEYLKLLDYDQLTKERTSNQAFRLRTFMEAPITFWPTYKYDPGTDMYDSSEKNRIPAWCDRILYRTDAAPFDGRPAVEPLSYRRYEVNISDHRPISGAYDVRVKWIIPGERRTVQQEVNGRWHVYDQEVKRAAREYYARL